MLLLPRQQAKHNITPTAPTELLRALANGAGAGVVAQVGGLQVLSWDSPAVRVSHGCIQ